MAAFDETLSHEDDLLLLAKTRSRSSGPATLLVFLPTPTRTRLIAAHFFLDYSWDARRLEAGPPLQFLNSIVNQLVALIMELRYDSLLSLSQLSLHIGAVNDGLVNPPFGEGSVDVFRHFFRIEIGRGGNDLGTGEGGVLAKVT